MMTLNITDPAILFPGISLLFLAYTNRYLAIANIIRQLSKVIDDHFDDNLEKQLENLLLRVQLIRWMQLMGILAFLLCIISIGGMLMEYAHIGIYAFGLSVVLMFISLCLAFVEVMLSGNGLRHEIERSHYKYLDKHNSSILKKTKKRQTSPS